MNIFILDLDLEKCAHYHCNKHVVKMVLEYAQILSTVCRKNGMDEGYKITHANHPCVLWAGECMENWFLVKYLALEVNSEYKKRYGRDHNSSFVIKSLEPPVLPILGHITEPAQAMPIDVKNIDVVKAYRNYYIKYKSHIAQWYLREEPWWYNNEGVLFK